MLCVLMACHFQTGAIYGQDILQSDAAPTPIPEDHSTKGIYLYRENEWEKDDLLATAAEYRTINSKDGFVIVDGDFVHVIPLSQFIEYIPYPDLSKPTDVRTADDMTTAFQEASTLKQTESRFPQSRKYLNQYLTSLEAEISRFKSAQLKLHGNWISKSQYDTTIAAENREAEEQRNIALAQQEEADREAQAQRASDAQQLLMKQQAEQQQEERDSAARIAEQERQADMNAAKEKQREDLAAKIAAAKAAKAEAKDHAAKQHHHLHINPGALLCLLLGVTMLLATIYVCRTGNEPRWFSKGGFTAILWLCTMIALIVNGIGFLTLRSEPEDSSAARLSAWGDARNERDADVERANKAIANGNTDEAQAWVDKAQEQQSNMDRNQ